jgi:hypothetical protein
MVSEASLMTVQKVDSRATTTLVGGTSEFTTELGRIGFCGLDLKVVAEPRALLDRNRVGHVVAAIEGRGHCHMRPFLEIPADRESGGVKDDLVALVVR